MKPIREQVPQRPDASFDCELIHGPDYDTHWHFHPEVQITFARRSQGYRMVGDNLSPLHDGDCVLIGSDVPHEWRQDPGGRNDAVQAIIVRFRADLPFLQMPEMQRVQKLLLRAKRGLAVTGRTRVEVAKHLEALSEADDAQRVIELLHVLDLLSRSTELKPLSSAGFHPVLDAGDQERMSRIMRYIEAHLTDEIARDDLARVAALSTGAFSRYFKSRTGKTLPEYVNELRIGRACRRLMESGDAVTDVAFDCGFRNLANFNRWFLKLTKHSPREYRRKALSAR